MNKEQWGIDGERSLWLSPGSQPWFSQRETLSAYPAHRRWQSKVRCLPGILVPQACDFRDVHSL
jgi:hypothetical protein